MTQGHTLQSALQSVCETKLLGTWRMALLGSDRLLLATNSGDLYLGRKGSSLVFCSEAAIQQEMKDFTFEKLK